MNKRKELSLSMFMSKLLRHDGKRFGLEKDDDNFVSLDRFIEVLLAEFNAGQITVDDINYLLESSEKDGIKRYQVVGDKVRATYNHTWKR